MWWKLLLISLVALALLAEREVHSVTTFYEVGIDSTSSTVAARWEKFYASQGIRFGRVVFAQFTWETDWGRSKIFKENHNGYGMKFRKRNRFSLGEKNGHAYYASHAASVRQYAIWQRRMLYARPDVKTEEQYLAMLDDYNVHWCPDCRYAEDKTYTDKIRARMRYLDSL